MNRRQYEILKNVCEHNYLAINKLLQRYSVTLRTLYYDIKEINFEIRNFGSIVILNKKLYFRGDERDCLNFLNDRRYILDKRVRNDLILFLILSNRFTTINDIADKLIVSKNTILNSINELRIKLKPKRLRLEYTNNLYSISGNERNIRNLYLQLIFEFEYLLLETDEKTYSFNKLAMIYLTDTSLKYLSNFINFIKERNKLGYYIEDLKYLKEAKDFEIYEKIKAHFDLSSNAEISYLCLYILSLANSNIIIPKKENKQIDDYINKLVVIFQKLTNISINNIEYFKFNLKRHLNSSYYRLKYGFPYKNPVLDDIKHRYSYLFYMLKNIVRDIESTTFTNLNEDEIGFLAMYFGSNIYYKKDNKNRVIIVCHNGIIISKSLENQIYTHIPNIEIIGTYSVYDLKHLSIDYDYIISTIELKGYENVIRVNALLTSKDITELINKFVRIPVIFENSLLNDVLEVIEENTTIINRQNLEKRLMQILIPKHIRKEGKIMLKEVLTIDKMKKISYIDDWKKAIREASLPLLANGSIEEIYVNNMIESVEKHGPYIVLDDYFAIPHASSAEGVNKFDMSLLYVEKAVSLLGKPVKVFIVLATPDKSIHLNALSSLSEIVSDDTNMKIILNGDLDKIDKLIKKLG